MEEVRTYWQVTSITHFCTLFQKPFKLPHFEPEELEQAFIIDVPVCENQQQQQNNLQLISNGTKISDEDNNLEDDADDNCSERDDNNKSKDAESINELNSELIKVNQTDTYLSSTGYLSPLDTNNRIQPPRNTSSYSSTLNYQSLENNYQAQPAPQQQNKAEEESQQDLHLLVKLAIALLKPHFNSKITPNNWENYLKRIVEANWIELEHYPSPFRVPFVSPEGIELTKNLNFNDLPLSDKIDLFSALCDYRFWCEDASEAIKDYPIEDLRLESIGKDQQGFEYWYFSGTRLFMEDKELTQDLITRKKRIKELEFELIDLEKVRIIKEQEEKKRSELEKAKKLAQEAREAKQAAKRKQEEEAAETTDVADSGTKRRKRNSNIIDLPPRTGLRERRSSAASNNHDSKSHKKQEHSQTPSRTTRGSLARQNETSEVKQQSSQKATRSSGRGCKAQDDHLDDRLVPSKRRDPSPEIPKKSSEEECREELERLQIKPEDRKAAWSVACESLEDWESFVAKFDKTKSTNERYLHFHLGEYILPEIRSIYAKRAAEVRRKEKEMLLSLATRRVSTRIISKKAQEEEEERIAQLRGAEIQKKKAEAELRLRAELEREMRARRNRFVINGEASSTCSEDGEQQQEATSRYNLRQQHDLLDDPVHEFDGIIHPDKLSDFYEALELIIDTVRTSKHAWPFVDAVPETVPGYYDLIKQPMDLRKLRTKVEFRAYKSLIELEKDFQLLVNNCERFNGRTNVYTKMVHKLWKSFRKNVQLYLQRDLHMDELRTFVYPPDPPAPRPPPSQKKVSIQSVCPNQINSNHQENGSNQEVKQHQEQTINVSNLESNKQEKSTQSQEQQPSTETAPSQDISEVKPQFEPIDQQPPPPQPQMPSEQSSQVDPIIPYSMIPTHPKPESLPIQMNEPTPETIVEEIIFDAPDNDVYIWQDTIVEEHQ